MSIIKNEIPILEFDTEQTADIKRSSLGQPTDFSVKPKKRLHTVKAKVALLLRWSVRLLLPFPLSEKQLGV